MVKFLENNKDLLVRNTIKFFILKHTGEEIISYVLQATGDDKFSPEHVYVFYPVKITKSMDNEGHIRYLMEEWISQRVSADDGFELKTDDVLVFADVEDGLCKSYLSFTKQLEKFKEFLANPKNNEFSTMFGSNEDGAFDDEGDVSDDDMENQYGLSYHRSPTGKKTIN